ncbi:TPA: hypothetical protein N0F65_009406 [Lagenidium giganteum]|uniref:Uncharacterized protein n=1 Tax=Lagenidium giganteum TaxID=4803 RepID=A0AAV2ZDI1_9STRA|nr:TPA: hypothetical protein N0F65_009406 [Lagenidium giganteum]
MWLELQDALESVWRKIQLFSVALLHLLFSSDKRWVQEKALEEEEQQQRKKTDAEVLPLNDDDDSDAPWKCTKVKQIVFIRHAESEWNVVFNRGLGLAMVFNLFRSLLREMLMLPTRDSIFIDAPLSRRGLRQAQRLYDHVNSKSYPHEDHLLAYLCSPLPSSVVVASNLRRAIDTARIASAARLELPGERIHVLSCLQEIGRNVDTLALSDAYAIEPIILSQALQLGKRQDELFNLSESHGNKAVRGCARQRLLTFTKWALCRQEDVVVVYGHSLWFKEFCREFMPSTTFHEAKERKMTNCGVAGCKLEERRCNGRTIYRIDPESFHFLR